MTVIAYSYIRYSTAEQGKGHSKERQEELCRAYCARHSLTLSPDVFFDEGVSGYTGKHHESGELGRFFRLVDEGEIEAGSYLLVENLDRLSRLQLEDGIALLNDLLRKGIVVVTLAPERVHKKDGDVTTVLSAVMDLFRANSESARKGDAVGKAFAKKRIQAQTGVPMGDVGPGWLRLNTDSTAYVEEPIRAAAVRRIFQLTIDGYGKGTVAKMLNEEKVPVLSKRKNVKGWGASAVSHVLKSRSVLGEYQPMTKTLDPKKKRLPIGEPIFGFFPGIVSQETFLLAEKAVESRYAHRVTKQAETFNVWGKVAKCLACGAQMHIRNRGESRKRASQGSRYLECSAAVKGMCARGFAIRLDSSERAFALMLARLPLLELVKDSGARLASQLNVLDAKILKAEKSYAQRKAVFEVLETVDVARSMEDARVALVELKGQRDAVARDLLAEDAIRFETFMQRLDLDSESGRKKANDVLLRIKVLAFIKRDRFVVTLDGRVMHFGVGVAKEDREPGYFDINSLFQQRAAEPLHVAAARALKASRGKLYFGRPVHAGPNAYGYEEDADQDRYDGLEDEGSRLTEAEVATFSLWENEGGPPGAA